LASPDKQDENIDRNVMMNKVSNPRQTESDTKNLELDDLDNKTGLKPHVFDLDEMENLENGKIGYESNIDSQNTNVKQA